MCLLHNEERNHAMPLDGGTKELNKVIIAKSLRINYLHIGGH